MIKCDYMGSKGWPRPGPFSLKRQEIRKLYCEEVKFKIRSEVKSEVKGQV